MSKDFVVNEEVLRRTIERAREKNIIIPTYEEMRDPKKIPEGIKEELKNIGLWDLHPRNLFRITWKNEPVKFGGGFDGVNYIELPKELTGVKARIFILLGKFFPTGAHKVGATFGPLVEKLVRGEFDPTRQKALWPSTGNYCRGGAYNSALLGCKAIAVLPEGMSKERFEWLKSIGAEVYATPGVESNVKEVFDKTKELKQKYPDEVVVLNQFEEFGNPVWHYAVTGPAMEEVFENNKREGDRFTALFLTQGSGGTLGSGNYLRQKFPKIKIGAGEALQCPTLLYNGYGAHRIEGIGDKHVPWVIDVKNLDMVVDIDDEYTMHILRLFNEPEGRKYLKRFVPAELVDKLDLLGISSIANIVGAIKMAKYYEMTEHDTVFTVATDSMELYQSRIQELREQYGEYSEIEAAKDFERYLMGITTDWMIEMNYYDKKRMHNLKYFTWVEQQGKTVEELNEQWYNDNYFIERLESYKKWDEYIREFNEKVGLIKKYR
ncbi:pyridoxal-phosphate dependent enzyme [Caldisericum exile]|uniref:Cysteine synthase n=1 Tax=Caldisericum exile (strain DSM 21853 / NBRC 104410 / AZM16c01) TaxID=511051 RepID=A0A7U6GDP1_CALEA|nr:pyridoxal-phosphate dependent enzyme [Caldisericum exile]BAL80503.1 putative cysteine synthase [Caldisericum exile AZM16c01]